MVPIFEKYKCSRVLGISVAKTLAKFTLGLDQLVSSVL